MFSLAAQNPAGPSGMFIILLYVADRKSVV